MTSALALFSEFLPWIVALFALQVVSSLLAFSEFQELANALPFLYYYVYYKVFRVSLELALRSFAARLSVDGKIDINEKIKSTSRFLGLILLVIYSLKTSFHAILGESLIFSMIDSFFGYVILYLLFNVSNRWKPEIQTYLKQSNLVLLQKYSHLMDGQASLALSLPGLFIMVFHFVGERFALWSTQFDFVKLIYARVLRVKYESTRVKTTSMPLVDQQYTENFDRHRDESWLDLSAENSNRSEIEKLIDSWMTGKSYEQTVSVTGPRGSGKTVFLKQCENYFQAKGIQQIRLVVPPKVFTEKSFEALFDDVLHMARSQKVIVYLDDSHNLFLSTIGGFQTYQKFLEKMEESENIFWIAAFGEFSWQFLNSVLGKNQYFRLELTMPRWSSEQIKTMILDGHKRVGWRLTYDQIFISSQRLHEGVTSAENRFFSLIWEKSSGNPGVAISYWFKSLRLMGDKQLKVSLPQDNPVEEFSKLHPDMHFVYASLIKHENLNVSEATRATNMPRSIVKQSLYRGLEEGFLSEFDGRYEIKIDWLDDLKKYLKGKNLIYES